MKTSSYVVTADWHYTWQAYYGNAVDVIFWSDISDFFHFSDFLPDLQAGSFYLSKLSYDRTIHLSGICRHCHLAEISIIPSAPCYFVIFLLFLYYDDFGLLLCNIKHASWILFSVPCILFDLASLLTVNLNLLYNWYLMWFASEILINHMFEDSTLHTCNMTWIRSCHIKHVNHCWLSIIWFDGVDLTQMLSIMILHATSVVISAASKYGVLMRWTTLCMIVAK